MRETEHYGLKQPEENDYGDVAVLNENADKLDAALDGLERSKAAANHSHTAQQVGADPAGSAGAVETKLNTHAGDAVKHVTAAERAAWNAKETPTGAQAKADAVDSKLTTHRNDGAIHVTAAQKSGWDGKAPANHSHTAADVGAAPSVHSHTKSQITDFPATMPPSAHSHTAADIGLGSVNNTSDLNKPISSATQTALNGKANTSHGHTAAEVGAAPANHSHTAAQIGAAPASHTHTGGSIGLVYGVCSTAASTTAKTVAASGFTLAQGTRVAVTFTYGVPTNATLNVDGTGARNIRWQGANIFGGIIGAGDTAELVFTGSYWYLLAVDRTASYGGAIAFADASWDIINSTAQGGLAQNIWSIGDEKEINLTTGEKIIVRIEDFDHDTLTSGGKAKLSLIMKHSLNNKRRIHPSDTNQGSWSTSEMRSWLSGTLLGQLPSDLRGIIKAVDKLSSAGNKSSAIVTVSDKLWLPSYSEINFPSNTGYSPGGEGYAYPLFASKASRVKSVNGSASGWWLRSPCIVSYTDFCMVDSAGNANNYAASSTYGVAVGFCI